MANLEKGEVALTVGDRAFTLILDFNAQCELEELLSTADKMVTTQQAFIAAANYSQRHIRALVWAMLRRHHAEVSLKQVGELIESAGGSEAFLGTLAKARKASEPEGSARPPKARQSKAGATTTSTRGGSGLRPKPSGE